MKLVMIDCVGNAVKYYTSPLSPYVLISNLMTILGINTFYVQVFFKKFDKSQQRHSGKILIL